jgi:hypothetical protein
MGLGQARRSTFSCGRQIEVSINRHVGQLIVDEVTESTIWHVKILGFDEIFVDQVTESTI